MVKNKDVRLITPDTTEHIYTHKVSSKIPPYNRTKWS